MGYDAIWLVPASPYKNTEAAFIAARYARENSIPFPAPAVGSSMR